jgi:hypothetical protein
MSPASYVISNIDEVLPNDNSFPIREPLDKMTRE